MKTPRILLISLLFPLVYACSHPLEIVGEGDITTEAPGTGTRGCSLEESTADPIPNNCSKNYVVGAYEETYTATPREGWEFDHWANCAFGVDISVESGNTCIFNVAADIVQNSWGQTMPPLQAVFSPGPELACEMAEQELEDLVASLPPRPVIPNVPIAWDQGPDANDPTVLPPDDRQPNIIVILMDDMGFNDVSHYNGATATLPTPAIDQIANQGVAFSSGYASHATCAPARAAIMTGRYPTRYGYEFTPMPDSAAAVFDLQNQCNFDPLPTDLDTEITNPGISKVVPTSEIFFAQQLKDAGYHTGHIGKWHLGRAAGTTPLDKGFDETLEMSGGLYLPEDSPDVVNNYTEFSLQIQRTWLTGSWAVIWQNGDRMEPDGYLTDYFTDEAVKYIEANKNRPFFLHLSHWGVHSPLQATQADYAALSHITDERERVYAGMIRAVDRSVERVMQALVDNGIDNNTLVIFTSDNGGSGAIGIADVNAPYRGFKSTFFEGGTHVPYFMSWPKEIPGGATYDGKVSHMDVFATAVAAAGAALPAGVTLDSVNLLPYVTGGTPPVEEPHDTLFWRNGFYSAVISDGWKMSVSERPEKVWLYNIAVDPLETTNLADADPVKVAQMQALIDAHEATQVDPLWDSFIQAPVRIDKTQADEKLETDEHVYWMN